MKYEPRSLGELIQKNQRWNINDFINYKSQNNIKSYYEIRKKYKGQIIQHIQNL